MSVSRLYRKAIGCGVFQLLPSASLIGTLRLDGLRLRLDSVRVTYRPLLSRGGRPGCNWENRSDSVEGASMPVSGRR